MKCYLVTDGGRERGNILIILIQVIDVLHINIDSILQLYVYLYGLMR